MRQFSIRQFPIRPRGRPDRPELPGLFRLRAVLLLLCLLAAGGVDCLSGLSGAGGDFPGWTRLLCAITAAAIPGAVAAGHGRAAVRTLLGLPPAASAERFDPSEELTEHGSERSATAPR